MNQKSRELLDNSTMSAWAACASIWSRIFVLSSPEWARSLELSRIMSEAFSAAMQRSIGVSNTQSIGPLSAALDGIAIEDDGSVEWNYMIDLIEMLSGAIKGQDASLCLETTLRVYLEGRFNLLARSYAIADGRPISYADAKQRAAGDVEWGKEVDFIKSLLSSMRSGCLPLACVRICLRRCISVSGGRYKDLERTTPHSG